MPSKPSKFSDVRVGDIFHATSDAMGCILCLTTYVEDDMIQAYDWCRGKEYCFDRITGFAINDSNNNCFIDSVEQLPEKHYLALFEMSQRYFKAQSDIDFQLTEQEKLALLFAEPHFNQYNFL